MQLGYIDSRKKVYVPEYTKLVEPTPSFRSLRRLVRDGDPGSRPVVIEDFDGPRAADGSPLCLEVTLALLYEKINDSRFPFGHGYCIAAALLGIPVSAFAGDDVYILDDTQPPLRRVFLRSMNMRGSRAQIPAELGNVFLVNATSMQRKDSPYRLNFSPMSTAFGGYKGYCCFENYWQAGKVFEGIPHSQTKGWFRNQTVGRRRYPGSKGRRVLYAIFPDPEPQPEPPRKRKLELELEPEAAAEPLPKHIKLYQFSTGPTGTTTVG